MKLGVGEYVAGKDLNVFYAKTKGGYYTNKGTTLPVKVSSVPILYAFPPTLKSFNIPAIFCWFKSKYYESQSLLHLIWV
jgi:hypothetical protein